MMEEYKKTRIAKHEAGHVVIARFHGARIVKVDMEGNRDQYAYTRRELMRATSTGDLIARRFAELQRLMQLYLWLDPQWIRFRDGGGTWRIFNVLPVKSPSR